MPLILASNSASGGYNVANSVRLNPGSSDYLNRTPAGAGNRRTFTFSFWYKKSSTGDSPLSLATAGTQNYYDGIFIGYANVDTIALGFANSAGTGNEYAPVFETTQLFRDPSAWYHIVISLDTTQATASNRAKMYLNGSQITSFSATNYPIQNYQTNWFNTVNPQYISSGAGAYIADRELNGYLSEYYFIDGQALDASSFGETDTATGIWKPKAYTGSFGTNGFYLQFKNSGALGTDSSGNGNTWTVNNLTSVDQSTDTPTNNFATINILTCNDTGTLTAADGNLTITGGNDMGATINISKGKWYWESKRTNATSVAHWGIGFTQSWYSSTQIVSGNGSGYFIRNDFVGGVNVSNSGSNGFTNISTSSTGSSVANGDIIGIALDLDSATKSVTFYQNGSQVAAGTFSYDGTTTFCTPFIRNNSGSQSQWNFGSPPYAANSYADAAGFGNFSYAVPSGYYALCTKNLANFG